MTRNSRRLATAALTLAAILTSGAALADPWIPAPGDGVIKPEVRLYSADHHFSPSHFSTSTTPSSKLNLNQFRISGVAGIGYNLSLEYDLRFAQARLSHLGTTHTSTGVQDQELGLNYGLTQTQAFADSLTFNVIFPTGAPKPAPALGTGRWAVEPDAQFGLHEGPLTATLIAGPRVFLDGGATQLRAELDLSARATQRLSFTGTVFFVNTIQQQHVLSSADQGEIYNLLRLGIGAQYRLTPIFRPFIEYDADIAGKSMHAGQRIIAGVAIHY
ncbi:hypothetical protein GCM10010909_24640 [Acidocella aquatica]|uniref:Outer membrane beta-barrel porin/alpha-amylase n=1 Tax=Acidocella aquatica TaxID=1922313 RepID=A0ABQ6A905_9PROT|nr:hypothetical protein [Acidocella aquatica]GLR67783.1 hypothetical protein GCM10010909_24640 [Acidocella aquatica]